MNRANFTPDSQEMGLRIEPTRCDCHPETCCHWPYSLMLGSECITTGEKADCERMLSQLNARDSGTCEETPHG
ncbi:hypothetical protein [Pseudoxanthomonas beigongshangi]